MAIMEGEGDSPQRAGSAGGNGGVPRWIRPQELLQTNPAVASQLAMRPPAVWVRQLPVNHMWDLFLQVGLWPALRHAGMRLTGIEIAPEAIASEAVCPPNWA